jgi:hypothetical protein
VNELLIKPPNIEKKERQRRKREKQRKGEMKEKERPKNGKKEKGNQKKGTKRRPYLEVGVRRVAEVVDDLLQRFEPRDAQRVAVARRRIERASDQVAQFGDKVPAARRGRGFETSWGRVKLTDLLVLPGSLLLADPPQVKVVLALAASLAGGDQVTHAPHRKLLQRCDRNNSTLTF